MRRGGLALLHHALPDPTFLVKITNPHASVIGSSSALPCPVLSLSRSPPSASHFARTCPRPPACLSIAHGAKCSCPAYALNRRRNELPHQRFWCTGSQFQARATLTMASPIGGAPEGYRPNVGLCLVNDRNEVFVASRLDIPDSWQMPQGGVDDGEDPRDAAVRELREETGVTSAQLIGEVQEWLTYDFPPEVKAKITRLWGSDWKGQAQKWFLFRFTGDDSEINLTGDSNEPPEFGDWRWLPAQEVLKEAVDFKKAVYAQAFKSLSVYVESWAKL